MWTRYRFYFPCTILMPWLVMILQVLSRMIKRIINRLQTIGQYLRYKYRCVATVIWWYIICYSGLRQGIYCDIPGLECISPEPKANVTVYTLSETWITHILRITPDLMLFSTAGICWQHIYIETPNLICSAYVKDFLICCAHNFIVYVIIYNNTFNIKLKY